MSELKPGLFALDLEPYRADVVVRNLRAYHGPTADVIANQIEAQIKPARIPEPLHWGSKVSSGRRVYLLLDIRTLGRRWLDEEDGQLYRWKVLADPVLVREGCC